MIDMYEKLNNLSPKEKNIFEIVFVLVIVVIVLGINLYDTQKEAKREQEESQKTVLVKDNSRYFTVIGCADTFIKTIGAGNKDDILLLLNNEYIEKNRINENNVDKFVPKLNPNTQNTYVGSVMYKKQISENVSKYFIKGKVRQEVFDGASTYLPCDLTITLYEKDFIFDVELGIGDLDYEE